MTMTSDVLAARLRGVRWRSALAGGLAPLLLAGCSAIPGSGPRTADIERAAQSQYVLVDLTADNAQAVRHYVDAHTAEPPVMLPPARSVGHVGPGDLLQVTVWEPNPTGTSLTSDKGSLQTSTRVGTDGTISVPYVGRLPVAGRTAAQIEALVTDRMAHEISGAQVSVLVTEDLTNAVIVQGDVARPGRYQVVPHASGLLDILALAGGSAVANRQTQVRITRGDVSVTRTLSKLVATHALETDLSPGDRILVQPRRSFFQAFGAVASPGEQAYDADDISLARTLGRLNGLSDGRADPAQVFVFRRQDADLTSQLTRTVAGQDPTAVIYRLNLRNPGGFFISQDFPILPNDLLYVSESPISEVVKVFQVINGVSGAGAIPRNLGAPY